MPPAAALPLVLVVVVVVVLEDVTLSAGGVDPPHAADRAANVESTKTAATELKRRIFCIRAA